MSQADNVNKAIRQARDPIVGFKEAKRNLLGRIEEIKLDPEDEEFNKKSQQKSDAYKELFTRLEKIEEAVIAAREDPSPPKLKQLYLHMLPFLQRTEKMNILLKDVPRVRIAVRRMISMGLFERAKKEFEASGEKLENQPIDYSLLEE